MAKVCFVVIGVLIIEPYFYMIRLLFLKCKLFL